MVNYVTFQGVVLLYVTSNDRGIKRGHGWVITLGPSWVDLDPPLQGVKILEIGEFATSF